MQPDQLDMLRQFLQDNKIAKVDRPLFNVLQKLGQSETKQTQQHDLQQLLATLEKEPATTRTSELIDTISKMPQKQIAAPVEPLAAFLQDQLKTPKPSFLGYVFTQFRALDAIHQKVTNRPKTGTLSWLKLGMIAMVILGIAAIAYLGAEQGWFDVDSLDLGFGGAFVPIANEPGSQYWSYQPDDLKAMIDNKTITKDDLPADLWTIVKDL